VPQNSEAKVQKFLKRTNIRAHIPTKQHQTAILKAHVSFFLIFFVLSNRKSFNEHPPKDADKQYPTTKQQTKCQDSNNAPYSKHCW
jgi:hypothetical protein